jgi:hypothetical protein
MKQGNLDKLGDEECSRHKKTGQLTCFINISFVNISSVNINLVIKLF